MAISNINNKEVINMKNKKNKRGLTYDQLVNLTKRAVARNMLKGDSLETALAHPDITYEFYQSHFVKGYIGAFGSDDQQNDISENETKLNEIMSSIPDNKIHELLKGKQMNPNKEQKHTEPYIYQAFAKFIKGCSKDDDIVACCNIFIRTDPNSKEYTEMCTMMNHVTNIAMQNSDNIAAWQSPKFQTLLIMRTAELSGKGIVNLQNGDTVEISKSKDCSKCHNCINRTGCYIEGVVAEIDGFIVSKCDRYHIEANPEEIAKNIAQSIVAVENDQSCALFVKDPINGNEYTLNITGFDDDGRLLANVVKQQKGNK